MAFCKRKKAATCENQLEQVLIGAKVLKVESVDRGHAKKQRKEIFRALTESMAMWLALTGPVRMA